MYGTISTLKGGDTVTRLREKRQENGMSQVDLACKAGVSAPFMCDLEAGRRGARQDTWERIADALGCPVEDITEAKVDSDESTA